MKQNVAILLLLLWILKSKN